jgi:glyoxylase-like metal-dependent hydrolase (beta-lactamase superfamily II)
MRIRTVLLLGLGSLAALALVVSRSYANPETIRIVAPGVWFREGDRDQGHCNNAIIEMKDYLIVVDAGYPSGARATMEDVRRISHKPVRYVFDTHHHGDHTYGNSLWTEAGATTLAFKELADEMQRLEPARWQAAAKTRPDVAEMHRDGPELPKQTINEPLYVLNDGSRKVEFRYFGWGHTRGDGYVYLPKEQVLCTGDAVVNGPYNNLKDADIAGWPTVLHTVGKLKIKFILPGHGMFGGRELLTGQEEFLTELHKGVEDGIAQGKTVEQIQASLQLPPAVDAWVGDASLKRQVQDTYREIKEGKPRGDLGQ